MKVSLTEKEYLNLRPNKLKDDLIATVRMQIELEDGPAELKCTNIEEALKKYDRELERSKSDEPILW